MTRLLDPPWPASADSSAPRQEPRTGLDGMLRHLGGGWTLLRDGWVGGAEELPARIGIVLIHARIGVALLEIPPHWTADAPGKFRRRLGQIRFPAHFPGYLPVVHWQLRHDALDSLPLQLMEAFDAQPPLSLSGDGARWAGAVRQAIAEAVLPEAAQARSRRRWRVPVLAGAAGLAAVATLSFLGTGTRQPGGHGMEGWPSFTATAAAPAPESTAVEEDGAAAVPIAPLEARAGDDGFQAPPEAPADPQPTVAEAVPPEALAEGAAAGSGPVEAVASLPVTPGVAPPGPALAPLPEVMVDGPAYTDTWPLALPHAETELAEPAPPLGDVAEVQAGPAASSSATEAPVQAAIAAPIAAPGEQDPPAAAGPAPGQPVPDAPPTPGLADATAAAPSPPPATVPPSAAQAVPERRDAPGQDLADAGTSASAPASIAGDLTSAGEPPPDPIEAGSPAQTAPAPDPAVQPADAAPVAAAALPAPQAPASRPPVSGPAALRPPPTPQAAPGMEAALLRRGESLLAVGDISGARRFFERAASMGSGEAALAAGGTYDPAVLNRLGVHGIMADRAQAATWYRSAAGLGIAEAEARLATLGAGNPP